MVFRETDVASGKTIQITPVAVTVTQPKPTTTTTQPRTSTGGAVPISIKEPAVQRQPIVSSTPYVEPKAGSYTLSEFQEKLGVTPSPIGQTILEAKQQQRTQAELESIPPTQYYAQLGYRPESPEYVQAISEISQRKAELEAVREQVSGAPEGTMFFIGKSPIAPQVQELLRKKPYGEKIILGTTPRYTREQAEELYSRQIEELGLQQRTLEEYKEKGYGLDITEKGYIITQPKATEVIREIYGSDRPDLYTATALRTGGIGFLASGAQELLGQRGALESWKEETAQEILGFTRRPGESQAEYTGRFWTSPQAITDVWLPVATLGISKVVTTAGRVLAPQITKVAGLGTKIAGVGEKIKPVIQKIPEPIRYVGFRTGFAGKTALYELSKPIGQQVAKYGFYTAMEAPVLVETAKTQPELFGKRLGESLFRYETGMYELESGIRLTQRGIREIRKPGFAEQPLKTRLGIDRLGLRPMGEEATQPVAGLRMRGRLGEMTASDIEKADIELARTYKEPKARVSAEELELDALARSMERKRPGLREFLKSEEGAQPVPGLRLFKGKEGDVISIPKSYKSKYEPKMEILGTRPVKKPSPTKGMTPDEALAFGFKEPKARVTPEEMELYGLARTAEKKGRLYLRPMGEEAIQPVPGLRFFTEKEPAPAIRTTRKTGLIIEEKAGRPSIFTMEKQAETPARIIESKTGKLTLVDVTGKGDIEFAWLKKKTPFQPVKAGGGFVPGRNVPSQGLNIPLTQEEASLFQKQRLTTKYRIEQRPVEGWKEYLKEPQRPPTSIVDVGYRPTEGWQQLIKTKGKPVRQYDIGYKKKAVPSRFLEAEQTAFKKTPLKFDKPTVKEQPVKAKPTETITTGDRVVLELEQPTKKTEQFKPSGLYESPDMTYVTVTRPLSRGEVRILRASERQGIISRYWEGKRPGGRTQLIREAVGGLSKEGRGLQPSITGRPETKGLMAIGLGSLIGKKPGEIDIGKEDTGLLTGRLSRLGELSIPTQDQPRLTENLDEMGLLDLTIQDVSQESLQDQLQQQLQETQQLQQQETRLDTMQETMLRQQRVKDIDRGIRYPRPPRPVDKTKIPRIPRVPKKEEPTDEKTRGAPMEKGSYHVEVKERGMYGGEVRKGIKFKRVTRNPLTRSDAMSLGAEITDTGSAVSFRLRRAKEKPSKLSKPVKDYTQRSYKFTKKNDVFIEKPSYRMDTPGELQEVSALGQQARRTGTFISNTTGHHRNRKQKKTGLDLLFLKTPSTRSTRRLSRNIKETGLFKKKKGDKKDAYY